MIDATRLAADATNRDAAELARAKRGLWIGRAHFFVFYGAMANFVALINVHLQNQGI